MKNIASRNRIASYGFLVLGGLVALSASQSGNQPNAKAAPPTVKSAEQVYKNVQVLKGIPSDQLIPAMQFISASLGVECTFCHVENHFDQDDKKPKDTARKMMQMTRAINDNQFEGHREVTCNTCHRGSPAPVSIPLISDGTPALATNKLDDAQLLSTLPNVDNVIDKFVAALGGANAIKKISTRVEKGTMNLAGHDIAVEVFDKAPDKRISITHLPDGDSITAFDGVRGWLAAPHRPTREMSASDLDGARMDADLQFALHLKQIFGQLKPGLPEKCGEHETYQLMAEQDGQPRVRLYFDQETGLLVRLVRYSASPLGLNPVRIDYADYRPVDGVQVAHEWTVARPAGRFTIRATDIKQNVAIEDATFERPNSEQAAAHQ